MRDAPDLDPSVLALPHGVRTRIRSIYGGDIIAENVPIIAGDLIGNAGQQVPERLTIQVPVRDGPDVWEPVAAEDPLNNFGQRLEVVYAIPRSGDLADIEVLLGQYRIQDWDAPRDVVTVEALGLEQVIIDDRMFVPSSPKAGWTYVDALEYLIGDTLPLDIDGSITDATIAQIVQWDQDRLDAINDILDAWGVRGAVSAAGVFAITPTPTPDAEAEVEWRDGKSGTVVAAPRGGSRDGIFNAVIARSSNTDLSDYQAMIAQATAYDERGESPVRWDGPFGNVPYFHESPLIKTAANARAAARTILQRVTRFAQSREVTAIPDPRVELGDIASVTTTEHSGATSLTGEVIAYRLPLTAAQGPAAYTVSTMGVV